MSIPFEPTDPTELLAAGPEEFVATGAGDLLLVDDNPANQAAMEAVLTGLVPRVVKVSSGREALRELLSNDFALILLDINMPDMDGFETAEAIRSRARSRHIPIIFLTAYDRAESEILRGYELGAVDFLFKPIVPKVLRSKAAAVLQLHRQAMEVARQAEQLRVLERREMRRRLAAEKQRWKTDALREENRRKDGFLAMLAHELRNPLVPIVSGLELIRTYRIEHEGLAKVRDSMERQADRLVRLVDDLIDVSRVSRGKVALRRERLPLGRVVHQAIESVRPLVDSRVQSLDVILRDQHLEVEGDEVRLTQVLVNLLHNASRYTPAGGSIGVTLELRDDKALIRVTDTGRGIQPEMLDHVFEMFVQERAGDEGLGLGLTLVKQLIELHGGHVHATSGGPGQGAEFEIQLPALVARVEAPAESTVGIAPPEQRAAAGRAERGSRRCSARSTSWWSRTRRTSGSSSSSCWSSSGTTFGSPRTASRPST